LLIIAERITNAKNPILPDMILFNEKMVVLVVGICNSNCLYYQDFQYEINKFA